MIGLRSEVRGQSEQTGLRSGVRGQSKQTCLRWLGLLLVGSLSACIERQPMQLEPPAVRPNAIVAYLVATPAEAPNEYVVRAVTRHGVALEDPGSFVAALNLAATSVTFIADASDANAVRVVAPAIPAVRVAGASDQGIANGELFALRVRAASADQINGLRLEISDLNDRSGASMRHALLVVPTVSWVSPR